MRMIGVTACAAMVLSGCNYFAPKLPASDVEAARTCWPVASAKGMQNGSLGLADLAEVTAYATIIAKAEPGPGLVTDKIGKVMNVPISDADKAKMRANLDSYQGQCRARFPVAAGVVAPTLPSDTVDRGMWCLMAATFLDKAMEGAGKTTYPEKDRLTQVIRAATAAVSDAAVAAKGIASEAQLDAYRDRLADALLANRLDKVVAACPAQ